MSSVTALLPSGGTSGRCVKVAATSTPGTIFHTAVSGSTSFDEITIDATNSSSAAQKVTVEFGGTTSPDDTIEVTIPAEDGPYRIVPGWRLNGGLVVRVFAATANVIVLNGSVNRIAP